MNLKYLLISISLAKTLELEVKSFKNLTGFGGQWGFNSSLFGICGNKTVDSTGQSLLQGHFDVGSSR